MTKSWHVIFAALLGMVTAFAGLSIPIVLAHAVSHVFKNLLMLISIPVIFLSILSTVTGMKGYNEVAYLGSRTVLYTFLTTIISSLVGLALFFVISPTAQSIVTGPSGQANLSSQHNFTGKYSDFLSQIVPSNIIQLLGNNSNVAGVVFVALLFSFAVLSLEKNDREILHSFFRALFNMMLAVARFILAIMPFGVWAFVTEFFLQVGGSSSSLSALGWYVVTVLTANIIQGAVVLPLLLVMHRLNPWQTFTAFRPALIIAFLSKSSNTALPVTLQCAQERAGIKSRVSSFVLPLCSTINMNGCAAFILITLLFVAKSYCIHLALSDIIVWVVLSTIAAIGNAGVPMGCYFLTSAFLAMMNMPIQLMGIILPLYALIDMVETALNVWSDACVTTIVNKQV